MTISKFLFAPVALGVVLSSASASDAEGERRLADAMAFVKLGYGDRFDRSFWSLSFATDRIPTEIAQAVIAQIDTYNAFEGKRVADALQALAGRVMGYRFGRDRSPVLYIELPYWTHQREGSAAGVRGERISEAEHAALVAELQSLFVDTLSADSFSTDPINPRTIIVWWD